jgi:hypothetical protein
VENEHALELEFAQIYFRSRIAETILVDPHKPKALSDIERRKLMEAILDEKLASKPLEKMLNDATGRAVTPVGAMPVAQPATDLPEASPVIRRAPLRPRPKARRLTIYASDPLASNRLRTRDISTAVVSVPWEGTQDDPNLLRPGPVGEYLEVVDVDHVSRMVYEPVNLNDPFLLASDGLTPSVGDPQFHQQMVYAVAMRTIANFERALGRPVLWASKWVERRNPRKDVQGPEFEERYVGRLRIYPHALRQRNAYYSPDKVALLFGYFPNQKYLAAGETSPMTFTCLSHDIIAHEACHAILDGLHRRYQDATNPDVLAFHEGFADLVAIFQHFTFKDMLTAEIQRAGPDLRNGKLLVQLAEEFGQASGYGEALRSALDKPDRTLANTTKPHDRGAILVAAVFDAFRSVFDHHVADLLRLASGGTGKLPETLHPDLVARLAQEATKTAEHLLTICIRALDYCPPVDITFGEYLRALITADTDVVGDDQRGYRVALLEAFAARGIYPRGIRSLSVDSLRWRAPEWQPSGFAAFLRTLGLEWRRGCNREEAFAASKRCAARLHKWLSRILNPDNAYHFGLDLRPADGEDKPKFEVHSVRPASRVLDDGSVRKELIIVITQKRKIGMKAERTARQFEIRGGATLIVDIASDAAPIRYAVLKQIDAAAHRQSLLEFQTNRAGSSYELYFGGQGAGRKEPFAFLHSQCGCF